MSVLLLLTKIETIQNLFLVIEIKLKLNKMSILGEELIEMKNLQKSWHLTEIILNERTKTKIKINKHILKKLFLQKYNNITSIKKKTEQIKANSNMNKYYNSIFI